MWDGTHKRGWRVRLVSPPYHMYSPLRYFHIEHWSYFILSCLVFDFECATTWYVNAMSWSNVPCAKLPP